MIDGVRTIPIGDNRCVRVGCYTLDGARRVFMAAGWASSPPLPVHAETVDIPADAVPALVEALRQLMGES